MYIGISINCLVFFKTSEIYHGNKPKSVSNKCFYNILIKIQLGIYSAPRENYTYKL